MKCELRDRDQLIDNFLLGKLSKEESDNFEIHIFGCQECFEEVRMREHMIGLVKKEREALIVEYRRAGPNIETERPAIGSTLLDFFQRLGSMWVYAAVTMAVLIVAVFVIQFIRDDDLEIYAVNFETNQRLESLLDQRMRSIELDVLILSPQNDATFESDISFNWILRKDDMQFSEVLELRIMDNKENVVFTSRIEDTQFNLTEKLNPGLYYWTLDSQLGTLYLGKFQVTSSDH